MIWIERILLAIAAAALVAIMLIMTVDAIGRYLLTSPVSAAFEVVQLLMAVLIFAAMPVVTFRREHVVVDLFEFAIPARIKPALDLFIYAACLLVALGYAWVLWKRGGFLAAGNEVTFNLGIRMAPIAYAMSVAWMICAVALVAAAIGDMRARARTADGK